MRPTNRGIAISPVSAGLLLCLRWCIVCRRVLGSLALHVIRNVFSVDDGGQRRRFVVPQQHALPNGRERQEDGHRNLSLLLVRNGRAHAFQLYDRHNVCSLSQPVRCYGEAHTPKLAHLLYVSHLSVTRYMNSENVCLSDSGEASPSPERSSSRARSANDRTRGAETL